MTKDGLNTTIAIRCFISLFPAKPKLAHGKHRIIVSHKTGPFGGNISFGLINTSKFTSVIVGGGSSRGPTGVSYHVCCSSIFLTL